MQQIRHDLLLQHTVGSQELLIDIKEEHVLAVIKFFDNGIGPFIFHPQRVVLVSTPRENRQQQDLGLR